MRCRVAFALCIFAIPVAAETPFQMPADAEAAAFVSSNVVATFYHELGHALIDVLQLPVLGREEDAADTLSALLINANVDQDKATAILYDTANAFALYDAESEDYEGAFADTHSLDLQRYYNLICLFYGADPDLREDVAIEFELPKDRAEGCAEEFELAFQSWAGLLEGLEPDAQTKGLKLSATKPDDPVAAILAQEIADLNKTYGLPEEIMVTVADCGEANAFYDPNDRSITICTEYVKDLVRLYVDNSSG